MALWIELSESENPILYSPVSAAELWAGARPHEHSALTDLFRALVCVPIDGPTGRQAGDYLRQYRKSHGLELGDALVASAALLNNAALWTRNRKHYPMKELSLLNRLS
ncbi:MAG: PIN domain-containing protein [Bryobacteraceae bacterium]